MFPANQARDAGPKSLEGPSPCWLLIACKWVASLQVKGLMLAPESLEAAAARVRRHFAGGGDDSGGPDARLGSQPVF